MKFEFQYAKAVGNQKNCSYPLKMEVTNDESLKELVAHDHVCATYKDNRRSIENFLSSNVVVMDLDNDHTEKPEEWIDEDLIEEVFDDYSFAIATSRNHLKEKDGKSARPRFHIYFEINETTDATDYASIKEKIYKKYPFFDGNALDAARFIFGNPDSKVLWHEGWMTIEDDVKDEDTDENLNEPQINGTIPQGSRNRTLSRFAARVLIRFGETEKALEMFKARANACDPPLDSSELRTIWNSAIKFFRREVVSNPNYIPPDDYNKDFDKDTLRPDDFTDIGESRVLVREFGNELKYTPSTDFIRYDGDKWCEEKQLAFAAVIDLLDLQLQDAKDQVEFYKEQLIDLGVASALIRVGGKALEKVITQKQMPVYLKFVAAKNYLNFIIKRRDYKYLASTLSTAKAMLGIDIKDLDSHEFLLNTPYATYNLIEGMDGAMAHNPADLITKITGVSPNDEGMDIWEKALSTFFLGDLDLISYVQQIVGMVAIGKVYQEHLIIAYGGGANGKSTFWNTIYRVLGDYSGKISAETLTTSSRRNAKAEVAEIKGKRLIIASEMEEGKRLNTSIVKQLCSTDEIHAEKKYKDPFSFIPSHTLVLYTNHLPKVGANDDGIWRRLIVIPFKAKITGKSDIKNYADYLVEKAGGAVLKWIIDGAELAIANEFKIDIPKSVEQASNKYHAENDWFAQFLDECCELGNDLEEKSGELYTQYRNFCVETGEYIRSTTDFYAALEHEGYIRSRKADGNYIRGLRLKVGAEFLE